MNNLTTTAIPDLVIARFNMVESQVRPNQVTDQRILDTMSALPRELFVPQGMEGIAYIDEDLPLGGGRFLMEPMVLARLVQAAAIGENDRVLDVGCVTGYSTALIAALAKHVTALECDKDLANMALNNLSDLDIHNCDVMQGALHVGIEGAAFEAIIINGGIEKAPDILLSQLSEGGRLLCVQRHFGPAHAAHIGEARLYEKVHGTVPHRPLFDANVKLLPDFAAKPAFVF